MGVKGMCYFCRNETQEELEPYEPSFFVTKYKRFRCKARDKCTKERRSKVAGRDRRAEAETIRLALRVKRMNELYGGHPPEFAKYVYRCFACSTIITYSAELPSNERQNPSWSPAVCKKCGKPQPVSRLGSYEAAQYHLIDSELSL